MKLQLSPGVRGALLACCAAAVSVTCATNPGTGSPGESVTFVGAGDIAVCGRDGDEATARILDTIPGVVFTLGDHAYNSGTPAEFENCYAPSWGRHKSRTRPSPGNHDYRTPGASGYFEYFGVAAGPAGQGYYSYDLGGWHIISLNSEVAAGAGSPQLQWLLQDLAANRARCTLAYWHKPRFSSARHGDLPAMGAFWEALYAAGADVVLGGHDHTYERFAPQTPAGVADPAHGIRSFVVGTGGNVLYDFVTVRPNSEVRYNATTGVLKLSLGDGVYSWEFIPVTGRFRDSGVGRCH